MKKHSFYPGDIPQKPGCYIYRDVFGTVIYVGKASNLRRRMSQYFQPSRTSRADAKLRSLINSIDSWEYIAVRNEDESLILETRLIKQYAPRYNILMRDDKRLPMLKIDLTEKYPRLKLARIKKDDSCLYFGPFPNAGALRMTMDFLVRHFALRTCKVAEPDAEDRAHCLSGTVRDCCAPCIGRVTKEEYDARIGKLIDVLNGNVKEIVSLVKSKMMDAALKKQFEKAAMFRDVASNMESLYGSKVRQFVNASVSHAPGMKAVEDLGNVLMLDTPPRTIECFDISNIMGTLAVASLVRFTDGTPDKARYRRFRIKTVEGANDFAMMKEAITRHFSRLIKEQQPLPDLLMVDGGKGQLSSALEGLVSIDCPAFPVIGLAKKHEEIFIPGMSDPIIVAHERPSLKLLQSIRDEAHRFAITYHRSLRLDTIRDSILDDIEGIGPERKKMLLSEFGSVRNLRRADADEIAKRVKGIGDEFARVVYEYLQSHKPDGGIDPL